MKTMRTAMILLAVGPLTAIDARPSGAETYRPWCVQYSGRGGGRSCAFTSFEQCMMTAGPGNGGSGHSSEAGEKYLDSFTGFDGVGGRHQAEVGV